MSAVIGMYGGREDNTFWRRVSNTTKFQIEPAAGQALGAGDVTILGPDIIHSVVNPLEKLSGAIHVYDGPFLTTPRSMWNAETLSKNPTTSPWSPRACPSNRHRDSERKA